MLDLAVRDIHPQDTLVVCPLIQQDTLYRAGLVPLQEDIVSSTHMSPRKRKGCTA